MKNLLLNLFLLLLVCQFATAQQSDAPVLKTILSNYYKTEKAIYKGRNQLLFLYCEKSNNNEEIFETINAMDLQPAIKKQIRNTVTTDTNPENWAVELDQVYATDQTKLNIKINACLSLEEYQTKQQKFNLNNQRLMIISKPIYYSAKFALVKVVFYRSIEHNNGSVLLMEKNGDNWQIKDFLNAWST